MLKTSLPAVIALAVALAACGSHGPSAPVPDMSMIVTGVPCADVQCAPCADQFCDTADYGVTGTCRAHVAANNLSFGCDGPEDCGPQGSLAACCFFDGIGAACSAAGCDTARHMCHQQLDCAAGERCCPLASGTTYSVCSTSC